MSWCIPDCSEKDPGSNLGRCHFAAPEDHAVAVYLGAQDRRNQVVLRIWVSILFKYLGVAHEATVGETWENILSDKRKLMFVLMHKSRGSVLSLSSRVDFSLSRSDVSTFTASQDSNSFSKMEVACSRAATVLSWFEVASIIKCWDMKNEVHCMKWFVGNWVLGLETLVASGLLGGFSISKTAASNCPIISEILDARVNRLSVKVLNFLNSCSSYCVAYVCFIK